MDSSRIAVIGYGLRVPGARDADSFWRVVSAGRDVVTRATTNIGATASDRVHAYGLLDDVEKFDEEHFGYSPREAADIDPQQRLLLLCAVEAFESAGIRPDIDRHDVGVWVATGLSGYLLETHDRSRTGLDATAQLMGTDGHYAATRIAFNLGLTGPAMSVGAACSSSLLAVHAAAQAIIAGECDLALAGGMDVEYPQPMSYLYQDGGILSREGVCRPFDKTATGTVFGSGGGLVLLADFDTAVRNGWPVLAELAGSAVNNDGSRKASFTAPRPARQADVIAQALQVADVASDAISYVECHGTGTLLGDQSELEALASVFGSDSGILLGSAKANFGHLRVGAGVVGLIKVCESFVRGELPPLANCSDPAEAVAEHGFRVAPQSLQIDASAPVIAGVSSFGFGGTNVHAVLKQHTREEAPTHGQDGDPVILQVSASTPDGCIANAVALSDHLDSHPDIDLGAVSHTLDTGRMHGAYRLAAIAADRQTAIRGLQSAPDASVEGWASRNYPIAVLFPGQGADSLGLARGLWGWEPVFTDKLTQLAGFAGIAPSAIERALRGEIGLSIGQEHALVSAAQIAVAEQLRARGMGVEYAAGFSLGEYAAAVVAGATDEEQAIELLMERGRLLEQATPGRLVTVAGAPEDLQRLGEGFFTAARIADNRTVIGCLPEGSERVRALLERGGFAFRETPVDFAFHTPLLTETAERFGSAAGSAEPRFDGSWIPTLRRGPSRDRPYWSRHLDSTIDFRVVGRELAARNRAEGLLIMDLSEGGFLGRAATEDDGLVDATVVRLGVGMSDPRHIYLRALAHLWTAGCELDTAAPRRRASIVRLPSRRWDLRAHSKPRTAAVSAPVEVKKGHRKVQRELSLENWAYHPSWALRQRGHEHADIAGQRWLLFTHENEFSRSLTAAITAAGVECEVLREEDFAGSDEAAMKAAIGQLRPDLVPFDRVVHLWCSDELSDAGVLSARLEQLDRELERGFYSLLFAFQELVRHQGSHRVHLDVVADGIHPLNGRSSVPERSLLLGPSIVLPQDYPFVTGRSIDISSRGSNAARELLDELTTARIDHAVVLDDGQRWVRTYERDVLPTVPGAESPRRLRDRGVYLITGGLGGIGMTLAEFLVRECRARLVLTGLDAVPDEDAGDDPAILQRREQIRRLEELGGEVLVARCDVASAEDTAQLMERIDSRFGTLNGVIHAAGVFETQRAFRSIDETGRDDCLRRLLPKVHGTLVLAEFLKDRDLDFVITQSSLSAQLGGLGFYAYTAGNAFMDAFTERHRSKQTPWMTVNWDGWIFRERGEDTPRGSVVSPSFASPDFGVVAEIAVRPSEGAEIYGRLMHVEHPRQVLISTADFNARVDQWVNAQHDESNTAVLNESADWDDPVAKAVATAWSEVLGVENLALEDNFFAVGGDSLLGVSLAHRLSTAFGTVFSAITLFENATLEQMIAVVRDALPVAAGASA